jgi:predicted Co/Zn/Cd cation transporter (cation efflux family)
LYIDKTKLANYSSKQQMKSSVQRMRIYVVVLASDIALVLSLYATYSALSIVASNGNEAVYYNAMLLCASASCLLCHRIFSSVANVLRAGVLTRTKRPVIKQETKNKGAITQEETAEIADRPTLLLK